MKAKPNSLEAIKFARKMQSGEIATTEENVKELCKLAGVKLIRVDMEKYIQRTVKALSKVKLTSRERQPKDPNRKYFRPSELAKMVGESRSTISRRFKGKPGVRMNVKGGPNRRTIRMMLISREAAKREYPDLDI